MQDDPNRRPPARPLLRVALLLVGAAAIVVLLAGEFPDALDGEDGVMRLVVALVFLAVVGGSIVASTHFRPGPAVRSALAWLAIGALAVLGYSYRHDLRHLGERILAELVPGRAVVSSDGAVALRRSGDGHFWVNARVDGREIRFLVDTGASDVALTREDARRIGFDPARLSYSRMVMTANGRAPSAPVRLGSVTIGSISLSGVEASVAGHGLKASLLGLSFLDRLSGYEVRGDRMILRP